MGKNGKDPTSDQLSRFRETARALGCDEDKEKFEAQLGKIAEHKPAKKPTQKKEMPRKKPVHRS